MKSASPPAWGFSKDARSKLNLPYFDKKETSRSNDGLMKTLDQVRGLNFDIIKQLFEF